MAGNLADCRYDASMAVRSRVLGCRNDLGDGNEKDLVNVPVGRTATVRGLIVVNHTTTTRVIRVRVRTAQGVAIISSANPWSAGEVWTPGFQELALGPGDRLTVQTDTTGAAGSVHAVACGSLLLGEPE